MTSCAVVAAFLLVTTAPAQRLIYVDDDAPSLGDGSSWEDAYRYLQDALADAETTQEAVEIKVAQGIYRPDCNSAHPDGTGDRGAAFCLVDGMTIKGGFAGIGAADPNWRDLAAHETILSGDLAGNDLDPPDPCDLIEDPSRLDNSACVLRIDGANHTLLDGLTIIAGYALSAPGSVPPRRARALASESRGGSGARVMDANNVGIVNCLFRNNCGLWGSALDLRSCYSVGIDDCTFTKNAATHRGGALCAADCDVRLTRCRFARNSAREWKGGAICIHSSGAALTECAFSQNTAIFWGGAVFAEISEVTLHRCRFTANEAIQEHGGGLCLIACEIAQVTDCTFAENVAANRGGAMLGGPYDVTIAGCHFLANQAMQGGALDLCGRFVSVADSTFIRNLATDYGGVLSTRCGNATLEGCRFVANQAINSGGVVWNTNGGVRLLNCTAVDNRAPSGRLISSTHTSSDPDFAVLIASCIAANEGNEVWNEGGKTTVVYSNMRADDVVAADPNATVVWGAGNIAVDPCFVDPGYWDPNGTPDDANDDFFVEGDYHLRSQVGRWDPLDRHWVKDEAQSLCIDAGDPHAVRREEMWPHGQRINLGGYGGTAEASLSTSEVGNWADLDDDAVVDLGDLALMGREWFSQDAPMRADLNRDERVDAGDVQLLAAEWLSEPLELRFVDYWPFAVGNEWTNANIVYDGGLGMRIVDRFAVNGFDIWQFEEWHGSLFGGWSRMVYYVYVNGSLYRSYGRGRLDQLPEITTGLSGLWPESVQVGQPIRRGKYEYIPVRMTLKQLAILLEEQQGWSILQHYSPEDRDLDVLAFTGKNGAIITAFGRNYGPLIDGTYCMKRFSTGL